jgi:acyl-CoA synthetase (AMP-forming)/AMP-acid ligase II
LAEATLAVSGLPLYEGWQQVEIDPDSVGLERFIVHTDQYFPGRSTVIGCGRALAGVSISIESDSNQRLSDGQVGHIVVRGNSVADGYLEDAVDGQQTRFQDDGLRTGDIGFVQDGQLFVLGRLGDSLKVRGREVLAEDVECALATLGIPAHRAAALLGWHKGVPTAVVLLERPAANYISEAHSILRPRVGEANLLVLEVPQGIIRRTSSGKIRRRELWRAFCEGDITAIEHS